MTRVLPQADIERAFDLKEQLRHVGPIFDRVFKTPVAARRVVTGGDMRARVFVTLKPSVFDPQGKTVTDALHSLGTPPSRTSARASTSSSNDADIDRRGPALASEAADKLLANPVIESYRIEIEDLKAASCNHRSIRRM